MSASCYRYKEGIGALSCGEVVEVVVDNEIAVQNLRKMADHKGLKSSYEKAGDREFQVRITAGAAGPEKTDGAGSGAGIGPDDGAGSGTGTGSDAGDTRDARDTVCQPDCRRKGMVVVLSSNLMGQGDGTLGKLLMKGILYTP